MTYYSRSPRLPAWKRGARLWLVLFGFTCAAQGAEWGNSAAPVVVSEARMTRLAPLLWVSGSVLSRHDARIAAEAAGRLTAVAEVGKQVQAGQVVARLDDTLARLEVDSRAAEVRRVEAQLAFLEKEVARLQRLARANNAARTQLDNTESQRDVALSELTAARVQVEKAEELLRRHAVKAPFSGVVTERIARAGEWVRQGDPVLRLVNVDDLEIVAHVPVAQVKYISPGDKLAVDGGGKNSVARLRALIPVGDEQSRLLELRLKAKKGEWVAGEAVRVGVPAARPREVLAVPRDALVIRPNGTSVFRVNNEQSAEQVWVSTGIAQGPLVQVWGDLHPGEAVIVRGGERMWPGTKVRIMHRMQP
ncbi:MAG TPA: efflux RND transporter periplasmic adaptor subunit [Gammaproteobacteria bacterium]|nr:efflux RND transporter periplasmic adaptor subunit [Gammaproteobacteria bacterium]